MFVWLQGLFWSCRQSIFEEMKQRYSQVASASTELVCVCLCYYHYLQYLSLFTSEGVKVIKPLHACACWDVRVLVCLCPPKLTFHPQ